MTIKRRIILPAALALTLLARPVPAARVEVASLFGSEMVLQCEAPVPVWGRAEAGRQVTVTFAGQSETVAADDNGRWSVKLAAMAASTEPRTLAVRCGNESVVCENVRVGEVWLVLSHGIGKQYACEGPVPNAHTRIRVYGDKRSNHSPTPVEDFGGNRAWGTGRYASFDLLTIPFAKRLTAHLGVPVGIVRAEVDHLDATIPSQGYGAIAPLDDLARQVETWYPTTKRGKQAYATWYGELEQWRKDLGRKIQDGQPINPSQPPLAPGPALGDPDQPTVVFNKQLHPLVPFSFRGVLHVHDAGTTGNPLSATDPRYADKMRALVAGLREAFERPELAFAFTQRSQAGIYHAHTMAGKERDEAMDFDAWYGHRDRQRRVLPFENTGMIVTLDVENYPGEVGERFARWALAAVYHQKGASSGPIYKRHRIEEGRVIVEFDHTDRGLMAATFPEIGRPLVEEKGGALRFFAVAGTDRIFHRAEARVVDKTVVVRSDKVRAPVAVRYACDFDPRGMDLYNRAGLPASPFCSDDWPTVGFDDTIETLQGKSPGELAAMLGYPSMLHSHAAARALASQGGAVALPVATRLLKSKSADDRCNGLRILGNLYWMGPVARGYYGQEPQAVTPAIARAIAKIATAAQDGDALVRRCAVEALSMIGSENDETFAIAKKLVDDDDPLVRTAVMRMTKYRFNSYDHNTALACALLEHRPFGDRTSLALAGSILNHYRIPKPVDIHFIARYLAKIGPGQGGAIVPSLGDMLRRVKAPNSDRKALDDPEVMATLLRLYRIGYRRYFLYGIWHWVTMEDHLPTLRKEIEQLRKDIRRLETEKPSNWQDLSGRHVDAIVGLQEAMAKAEESIRKKSMRKK